MVVEEEMTMMMTWFLDELEKVKEENAEGFVL